MIVKAMVIEFGDGCRGILDESTGRFGTISSVSMVTFTLGAVQDSWKNIFLSHTIYFNTLEELVANTVYANTVIQQHNVHNYRKSSVQPKPHIIHLV